MPMLGAEADRGRPAPNGAVELPPSVPSSPLLGVFRSDDDLRRRAPASKASAGRRIGVPTARPLAAAALAFLREDERFRSALASKPSFGRGLPSSALPSDGDASPADGRTEDPIGVGAGLTDGTALPARLGDVICDARRSSSAPKGSLPLCVRGVPPPLLPSSEAGCFVSRPPVLALRLSSSPNGRLFSCGVCCVAFLCALVVGAEGLAEVGELPGGVATVVGDVLKNNFEDVLEV